MSVIITANAQLSIASHMSDSKFLTPNLLGLTGILKGMTYDIICSCA